VLLLWTIAAVVYLCRAFVLGNNLSTLMLSYKLDTLAMVVLVTWTLFMDRRQGSLGGQSLADAPSLFVEYRVSTGASQNERQPSGIAVEESHESP